MGNVELCIPYDKGVLYKTQEYEHSNGIVKIVSNMQLYMDLFSSPARGEESAEQLRAAKIKF